MVLLSNIRPYFKKLWKATFDGGCSADVLCFVPLKGIPSSFLYYTMSQDSFFEYVVAGSNGVKMPRGDKDWIMKYPIVIPEEIIMTTFQKSISVLTDYTEKIAKEKAASVSVKVESLTKKLVKTEYYTKTNDLNDKSGAPSKISYLNLSTESGGTRYRILLISR